MKVFDYICTKCENITEEFVNNEDERVTCSYCHTPCDLIPAGGAFKSTGEGFYKKGISIPKRGVK
ncbi:MAG: hypothetical protein AAB922_07855 [Patescibacteria group bacterium]